VERRPSGPDPWQARGAGIVPHANWFLVPLFDGYAAVHTKFLPFLFLRISVRR